ECLDLESQLAVDRLLRRAGLLKFLHFVAVLQNLEMLPRRKQSHADDEQRDAGGAQEIALLLRVNRANDGVVADVLLDGVLDVDAHASFSTARRRALRDRGFRRTSSSPGTTGFL